MLFRSNAAGTTATAFQMTVSVATLVRVTRSASTAIPWSCLAGIPASSTAAFGSVSLTRGQNIGQTTGTTPMMCISSTPGTAITSTTVGIPALELHSASPCNGSSSPMRSTLATDGGSASVDFSQVPYFIRNLALCVQRSGGAEMPAKLAQKIEQGEFSPSGVWVASGIKAHSELRFLS